MRLIDADELRELFKEEYKKTNAFPEFKVLL